MAQFVNVPFRFANSEKMTFTIMDTHILERTRERFGLDFSGPFQCARYLSKLFRDERLLPIYYDVPIYSTIALYMEENDGYFFFTMGTQYDPNEVKLATVVYRNGNDRRVYVGENDICFVLPKDGSDLKQGKDSTYFKEKDVQKEIQRQA